MSYISRRSIAQATVIGCTTTGASIYSHLLESVPITTVIIEEAGEVLEAHVLTSLTHSVRSLPAMPVTFFFCVCMLLLEFSSPPTWLLFVGLLELASSLRFLVMSP